MGFARSSAPRLLLAAALLLGMIGLGAAPGGAEEPDPVCRIAGLASYATESARVGSCSQKSYVRACSDALTEHRLRCQEFCASFQVLGGRTACEGSSKPKGEVFDSGLHCRETGRDEFEIRCTVRAECTCTP